MGKTYIRWASKADAADLSEIAVPLARETYPYLDEAVLEEFISKELSPEGIEAGFDSGIRYAFVEYNGGIAGITAYVIHEKKLHIDKLYLVGNLRGMGLGTDVIRRLSAIAEGMGCTDIELTVVDRNTGAANFYESLGFRRVSSEDGYAEPRSIMSRALVRD